jgi:hypothetical protein
MMSIPGLTGHFPSRWHQVVDIMLEKKPNDQRVHRLRIIALQESDFNQANRLMIGRLVQHKLEDQGLLPDTQHGSRSAKQCHSAVLNKVITFEIHRYKKQLFAYVENDAVGCFDRIANPLVFIFHQILGVNALALASPAKTWESSIHRIRSAYGISAHHYANEPGFLLFGPGQGSTIGPFLRLLCFLLISLSLSASAPRITIMCPEKGMAVSYVEEAFVDDTGLGTNATGSFQRREEDLVASHDTNQIIPTSQDNITAIITNLQSLAQEWERLLFSTGGALNLEKCFCFLLAWHWDKGRARLHTSTTAPGVLSMTSKLSSEHIVIRRAEPTEYYRTLGVYLTPNGCNKGAISILREAALTFCSRLTSSRLNRKEALFSYIQYLLPKLRYQPLLLTLSKGECDKLMSPVLMALLLKLHLNRHMSRSIIHGPEELGGLALPHLFTLQRIDKIMGHLRLRDRTAKLIHIDLSYIQLILGIKEIFLNQDYTLFQWMEAGWVTSLWEFAYTTQISFDYPTHWHPAIPREHDKTLMDHFTSLQLPSAILGTLNRCRLYLQVITVSDIAATNGLFILQQIREGRHLSTRRSRLEWPNQGRPSSAKWAIWKVNLSSLESYGRLIEPLGKWVEPSHQRWEHFLDPATNMLYVVDDSTTQRFQPILTNVRTRAGPQLWINLSSGMAKNLIPENMVPASVIHNSRTTGDLA